MKGDHGQTPGRWGDPVFARRSRRAPDQSGGDEKRLSDRERRMLAPIERDLQAEDPELTRRLGMSPKSPRARGDAIWAFAVGLCLLLAAFAFMFDAIGEAVVFATLAASVAMVRYWVNLAERMTS